MRSSLARAAAGIDAPSNEDQLGLALLELLDYLGDRLSYYQEAVATEAYLDTARERISLRRHARLVDYELRSGLTMSTQVAFELGTDDRTPEMLTIPAGTLVQSSGPEKPGRMFQTLEEIVCCRAWNALRPRPSPANESVGQKSVVLDGRTDPLPPGRVILVSGVDAVTREEVAEVAIVEGIADADDSSKLHFAAPLHYNYDTSFVINGNVAAATHGEAHVEVLGSGDASLPGQSFQLSTQPLRGVEDVIDVRVNGVRWVEVPSLLDRGPHDHVFVVEVTDDGSTTLWFGDGKNGAPLPTGTGNVIATYRTGLGADGTVATPRRA